MAKVLGRSALDEEHASGAPGGPRVTRRTESFWGPRADLWECEKSPYAVAERACVQSGPASIVRPCRSACMPRGWVEPPCGHLPEPARRWTRLPT
eukprot:6598214-Heterocapsa_arctica.AAC.1